MLEILVIIFVLLWATMLFAKYLIVEIWAVTHGQESPRLARKAARKELARQWGVPTVGQAIENRIVRRIENPPERRWLAQARELVREVFADSIAEARIRHHVNSRKRAARYASARFRTGGKATAPPPPRREPPQQGVPETWACRVCPDGLALHPGGLCRDCEDENASAAAAADPGPDLDEEEQHDPAGEPATDSPDHEHHDTKDNDMSSAIHRITVDVNDPISALNNAQESRGFADGVDRQFEILTTNLKNLGMGPEPLRDIRVMRDQCRTYSDSLGESVKEYAEHIVIQREIYTSEDLRDTVADTYLDGNGNAVKGEPPAGEGTTINAVDCRTPEAARDFMQQVAGAFDFMRKIVDHVKGEHERQGVAGMPVEFLARQLDLTTTIAGQARRLADTFAAHIAKRNDTIGSKQTALGGTQDGKYLSRAGR